jgi:UDP-3-O-[3-hydroxymyristoyl] glucosamine N-acyltransferase
LNPQNPVKKSLLRRIINRPLQLLARFAPGSTSLRPFLHKLRGVKITGRVFIGEDVILENEYPENVELEDGAQVGLRSVLLAHTRGSGRIIIQRDAFIGANCVIIASPGRTLCIGTGAVVSASTVVTTDVPSATLFGMEKPKQLARATVPLKMDTDFNVFLAGLRPIAK